MTVAWPWAEYHGGPLDLSSSSGPAMLPPIERPEPPSGGPSVLVSTVCASAAFCAKQAISIASKQVRTARRDIVSAPVGTRATAPLEVDGRGAMVGKRVHAHTLHSRFHQGHFDDSPVAPIGKVCPGCPE